MHFITMASKWSSQFCLLWLCLHVVCGRDLHYEGRERERLNRHLLDPPIYNVQFEGHHREGDPNERHNLSGSTHNNSIASYDITAPDEIRHWAHYETTTGEYYGTQAKINLWGHPDLKPNQRSSTALWVVNFDSAATNLVEAGFHVYPALYQDTKLHFFIFWTADGYKSTGCYNLKCKGFVMVNWNVLTPGDIINDVSTYNGPQYYITLGIKKGPQTGDWLLFREDTGTPQLIGYWPKSLFTTLAKSATTIRWGGFVSYFSKEIGPPMGSGHYASELEGKAAYMKNIQLFNSKGESYDLLDGAQNPYTDTVDCYNVSALVNSGKYGFQDGCIFYFGGPAGCTK